METGRTAHTIKANFKPSSSNEVLSYATMPRGGDKKDLDFQRWRNVEENNNENAFSSYKGLFIKKIITKQIGTSYLCKGEDEKKFMSADSYDCKMCFDGNS